MCFFYHWNKCVTYAHKIEWHRFVIGATLSVQRLHINLCHLFFSVMDIPFMIIVLRFLLDDFRILCSHQNHSFALFVGQNGIVWLVIRFNSIDCRCSFRHFYFFTFSTFELITQNKCSQPNILHINHCLTCRINNIKHKNTQ